MADEYLWGHQWDELDDALRDAGCHPSGFERRENLTRKAMFSSRPVALPRHKQSAGLYHRRFGDDIFLRLRAADTVGAVAQLPQSPAWYVTSSPPPEGPRRELRAQPAADFDEVVDLARDWAEVAAKELRSRGVTVEARKQAADFWSQVIAPEAPRAITRVSGFVHDELPRVVAQRLQEAGESDEVVMQSVTALRARAAQTIADADSTDVMSRSFPEVFARDVGAALRGKVADRTADLVIGAVTVAVGKFFNLW